MVLASGTRVSLAYAFEAVRGTAPNALQNPIVSVNISAPSGTTVTLTRASGSFVTDGFVQGQWVGTLGYTNPINNGSFKVLTVAALTMTVYSSVTTIVESGSGTTFLVILLNELRATERNINFVKDVLESAEVRPTRQIADVRHGGGRVEGSAGFELGVRSYDDMLEMALSGTWISFGTSGVNLSSVAADNTFVRDSGSFVTEGYRPGDIVVVAGFTATAMNIQWRVLTVTATVLTVYDPTNIITDESAGPGKTITLVGARMDVGANLRGVSMERRFADVSQYQLMLGVCLNQLSLSISPEAIVGGTADFIGLGSTGMLPVSISPTTPRAAPTNGPFAAFDGQVFLNGAVNAVVTSVELTLNNNRTTLPVVGSVTSPDVFEGRCMIEGSLSALFETSAIYNLFFNEQDATFWTKLNDPNDVDFMNIVIPRLKAVGAPLNPPQEGPVPIEMAFRALEATVNGTGGTSVRTSISIQRSYTV